MPSNKRSASTDAPETRSSKKAREADEDAFVLLSWLLFDPTRNARSRTASVELVKADFDKSFSFLRDKLKSLLVTEYDFRVKAASIEFYTVGGLVVSVPFSLFKLPLPSSQTLR